MAVVAVPCSWTYGEAPLWHSCLLTGCCLWLLVGCGSYRPLQVCVDSEELGAERSFGDGSTQAREKRRGGFDSWPHGARQSPEILPSSVFQVLTLYLRTSAGIWEHKERVVGQGALPAESAFWRSGLPRCSISQIWTLTDGPPGDPGRLNSRLPPHTHVHTYTHT